jgi:hypothetical protein
VPQGFELDQEEGTTLRMDQFLSFLVALAFYRENPRFTPYMEGAPKLTVETVPLLQTVQSFVKTFVPKMRKGEQAELRQILKADKEAQEVLTSYGPKVGEWLKKLGETAEKTNSDVYAQYMLALEETGSLGVRTLDVTEASGIQVTHKSSLTEMQSRHAFLDAQAAEALAVADPSYELDVMLEVLARLGDKKYATVMAMGLGKRVESMLRNVLDEATEIECLEEVCKVDDAATAEASAAHDEKVKAQVLKNWLVCWKNMSFKDFYGYPLWETQLHDVLSDAFPELSSIFLYYTGSSVLGCEDSSPPQNPHP